MGIGPSFLILLRRTMSLPGGFVFKKTFSRNHAAPTTPRRAKRILPVRRRNVKSTFF
ncbi:hypothetical protein EMCG_06915 [[Emmonsia] crescens]|uniref:Uncharacterized protein n=1 Tax=[Emmonsia] crescens TaxID=73230 RepID=A0A0G2I9X0_9EURO|nr:hypothetical protein EMCG_06915 [Emmonsia crescens UAMH 3008]